jgi:hypothetical protein
VGGTNNNQQLELIIIRLVDSGWTFINNFETITFPDYNHAQEI